MRKILLTGMFLVIGSITFAQVLGEIAPREAMTLWQLIKNGGVVMAIIILLSFFTVALVVRFVVTLKNSSMIPEDFEEELKNYLARGDRDSALKLCRSHDNFLAKVVRAGIENISTGRKEAEMWQRDSFTYRCWSLFGPRNTYSIDSNIKHFARRCNLYHSLNGGKNACGNLWETTYQQCMHVEKSKRAHLQQISQHRPEHSPRVEPWPWKLSHRWSG